MYISLIRQFVQFFFSDNYILAWTIASGVVVEGEASIKMIVDLAKIGSEIGLELVKLLRSSNVMILVGVMVGAIILDSSSHLAKIILDSLHSLAKIILEFLGVVPAWSSNSSALWPAWSSNSSARSSNFSRWLS
jgi:hypothetical protein